MLSTTRTDVRVSESGSRASRPPRPEGLHSVELNENARTVLVKRYLRRGVDGQPVETIEEMFWRVAYHVAEAEREWAGEILPMAEAFYGLLTTRPFFPHPAPALRWASGRPVSSCPSPTTWDAIRPESSRRCATRR